MAAAVSLERLGAATAQHQRCAGAGKRDGGGLADSGARARHPRDLA
jgi:hypothetical protein